MDKIVSFPHMAEAYIIARSLFENIGCNVLVPPYSNEKTMEKGVINSPEFCCIPYKLTLGNMIEALDLGANVIFMLGGSRQGICRLPQYPINQEKTLKRLGYNFEMKNTDSFKNIVKNVKSACREKPSNLKIFKALKFTWSKLLLVDKINELSRFYRAYEIKIGETNKIKKHLLSIVDEAKIDYEIKQARELVNEKFDNIKIDKDKEIIRIGIGGEFFVTMDYFVNRDIEKRLGEIGVLVENPTTFAYLIKAIFGLGQRRNFLKLGYKYVPITSGGEDIPTLGRVEYFAKKGFDGYITLSPFGCMPESSVKPFIHHISKRFALPTIHFSFDENMSETYLDTRLSAFVNTIRRKKEIKNG